ncbi:MAG: substrate-binding domain-containing protein [Anaerolineae bacterium]|nr:substrate-binding domain-containing protein [Anaerolineae bacterium]
MSTPKINWILLVLYALVALGVLIASFVSPSVRAMAYAPLRDLLIPPPKPIVISVLYSTEKALWMEEAVESFAKTKTRIGGRPIEIELETSGSREMYLAVLDGKAQPDLISPASMLQIALLEDLSTSKFGHALVNPQDKATCRPVLTSPLVLVAWKDRATVLWGDDPNGNMWRRMHNALVDPQGWGSYGHPEWGYIKFGHTNPLSSNSGFQTLVLMTYNYFEKTHGLVSADILANPEYQQWLIEFESTISKFGDSTGTYMNEIISYGPSMYDFVAVYEATAIEQLENAVGRYGELYLYYPPATSLSDHPFCVLQADWVSPEKAQAAQAFVDFLTGSEMQELALLEYGFRPVDPAISLEQSGSPFTRYTANGVRLQLPPEVETPRGDVLQTLLDFWQRNVQR